MQARRHGCSSVLFRFGMHACRLWWWCNTEEHPTTNVYDKARQQTFLTRPGGFNWIITMNIQGTKNWRPGSATQHITRQQTPGRPEANYQTCGQTESQMQKRQTQHQGRHAPKHTANADGSGSYSNFQHRSGELPAESTAKELWPHGFVARLVCLAVFVCLFCSLSWV